MKLLFQCIVISIVMHVLYIISQVVYGVILMILYVPDNVNLNENVTHLQNEVAF